MAARTKTKRKLIEGLIKDLQRQCENGTLMVGKVLIINGQTLGIIKSLTVNEIKCEEYRPTINGERKEILIEILGMEKGIICVDVPPTMTELEHLRYI